MAEPTLVGANITFHTNDEDKDDDTHVSVTVQDSTMTTLAAEIADNFGHFDDNSDAGPFELVLVNALTRDQLKTGNMTIAIKPNGHDTWRFNFFLDLRFSDGSHLLARANHLQLTQTYRDVSFGIE
jgi:hypothetical protein